MCKVWDARKSGDVHKVAVSKLANAHKAQKFVVLREDSHGLVWDVDEISSSSDDAQ
jgi:hypothetical protein